jgi:ADP-heptose:LPS heptosyltransferase
MRILATNPDTIGDLVLRQPLYAALQEAGHDLMLIVRPLLEPIVSLVAPGAAVVTCRPNVYNPRMEPGDTALDGVVEAATKFAPELFLVTPYQWTHLEERLALEFPEVRCIAMSGRRFTEPQFGPAPPSNIKPQQVVQVAEDAAEVRKNELFAAAVLGKAVKLPEPRLVPAPEHLHAAEAHLSRLGLESGKYWIACIGHGDSTKVRNWSPERWAELLSKWARSHGRRFLMVGHESERPVTEEIRRMMGDQAAAGALWSGDGDGDLDVLLGLIAHSSGYVGRDTGPMHLAAALEKPVLAIFGGGTWPRFVPSARRSVTVTMGVPCTGCNWKCHLPESYCIKEVPVEQVLQAAGDLEAGRIDERIVRVLAPPTELLSTIGREGAESARDRLTQLSVSRRQAMEQTESMAQVLERTARQAGRAEVLEQQLEALRSESNRRESVLKQRLAAAENLFRTRESELERRIQELESGKQVPAIVQERLSAAQAEWSGKLAAAQERSRQVHDQLQRIETEAADLRVKLERALADQQALMSLTRQQEQQLGVLHQRLRDLLHSRWRKYGQRLRLCMTLPWEQHYQNGKH